MSIGNFIVRVRAEYHLTCIDINDALYQLGLIEDDRMEELQKRHTMAILNDKRMMEEIAKMEKK